jgi:hypothetical protein
MITLEVIVSSELTPKTAEFTVEAETVTQAFKQIPMRAASLGFGLAVASEPISYTVNCTHN